MNERIRELAKQCWDQRPQGQLHFDNEKFAELIVKECANEILKWKSEPFPFDPEFAAKLLKDHFGIK